jgi:hypothetical protein
MEYAKTVIELVTATFLLFTALIPLLKSRRAKPDTTVNIEYKITSYPNFLPTYCQIVSLLSFVAVVLIWLEIDEVSLAIAFLAFFYWTFAFKRRTYPIMREEIFTLVNTLFVLVLTSFNHFKHAL